MDVLRPLPGVTVLSDPPEVPGIGWLPVRSLAAVRGLDASAVLSSHLPSALGGVDGLLDMLRPAPDADPFTDPDQRALEQLPAGFQPGRPDGGPLPPP